MERAGLTGSNAPQRALAELERLAARGSRVARGDALAELAGDPLAVFAAPALDDGLLRSTLARIEGVLTAEEGGAASAARPRRGLRRGTAVGHAGGGALFGSEAAPAVARPTVAREHARRALRDRAPVVVRAAVPADAPSPLATVATRVAGGVAAIATPVATATRAAEPGNRAAEAVALEAVLARFSPDAGTEAETTAVRGPSRRRPVEPRAHPGAPVAEPGSSETRFGRRALPEPATAAVDADLLELTAHYSTLRSEPAEPLELAARSSGQGLAELVRRWESTRPESREDARRVRDRRDDAPARELDETALAQAVERLLMGELRRSGIEVELG